MVQITPVLKTPWITRMDDCGLLVKKTLRTKRSPQVTRTEDTNETDPPDMVGGLWFIGEEDKEIATVIF